MSILKRMEAAWNRTERDKINGNWGIIEQLITTLRTQLNNIVASAGNSNSENVAARTNTIAHKTYNTMGERLDAEYAQKADKADLDAKFEAVGDGSPVETFATYADLVAKYPSGKKGVYLVTEDGHWYYWNIVTGKWEDGGVYQASEVADNSVTASKINTKLKRNESLNLFDKSTVDPEGYYDSTGQFVESVHSKSSSKIQCRANEVFARTTNIDENNYDNLGNHFTFWDENDSFVTGVNNSTANIIRVPNDESIAYMRVNCSPLALDKAMLVRGSELPSYYHAYGEQTLSITDNNIDKLSISKINGVQSKRINLINKIDVLRGGYYNVNGEWIADVSRNATGKIKCRANDIFARTVDSTNTLGIHIGNHFTFWDDDDNFVVGLDAYLHPTFIVPDNPNITYMRTIISNLSLHPVSKPMLVRGDKLPEEYYSGEDNDILSVNALNIEREAVNTYQLANNSVTTQKIKDGAVTKDKLAADLINVLPSQKWADGIIKPFDDVVNPIITKEIVTDRIGATGVADPFIVKINGCYHAFFEVLGGTNPKTGTKHDEIGHAYSYNLKNWTYTSIVFGYELNGHRAAYPNVIEHEGDYYMLPDLGSSVKVYKCTNFPNEWTEVAILARSTKGFVDTNVYEKDGIWYMTTNEANTTFRLYVNMSGTWLNDQWTEHPMSPIFENGDNGENAKRGGGHVTFNDGEIYLPMQATPISTGIYGQYVDLYKISNLSPTQATFTRLHRLSEQQNDGGFAHRASHHICSVPYLNKNAYLVDGYNNGEYAIGLFMDM